MLPAIWAQGNGGSRRPPSPPPPGSPPFSVSSLSSAEGASGIPLSSYQSPFPWEATGDPGKVLRVMKQNLHHSGSNFPSFVAKNKTCPCSSLPVGLLLGFQWEPLFRLSPFPVDSRRVWGFPQCGDMGGLDATHHL